MMNNLYTTYTMLEAVKNIVPLKTFIKDRYFPDSASEVFPTEEVIIDFKDGHRKMAPYVLPRKKGITIEREGFRTERYKPPYIAPQRRLTYDDLNRRMLGEQLFSSLTPEERQTDMLGEDLLEMTEMIQRREEWQAMQVLLHSGVVMQHYANKYGSSEFQEFELRFYDGPSNPNIFTVATPWDQVGADIFLDLHTMVSKISQFGLPATDLIVSPDVMSEMLKNDEVYKMLDNRRVELGNVAPTELPDGVGCMGTINAYGRVLNLFTYDEQFYNDLTDQFETLMPQGTVILASPALGRPIYGAVTQVEEDGQFHSYAEKIVPKYLSNAQDDVRELKLTTRPVFVPNNTKSWLTSKVI